MHKISRLRDYTLKYLRLSRNFICFLLVKMSKKENFNLTEGKMDVVEEKIKESMSGDNRGPNEIMAGSESNKDSKINCNPINEVERVVKLEKKSSKKGFFAPFKPPQKLVSFEF